MKKKTKVLKGETWTSSSYTAASSSEEEQPEILKEEPPINLKVSEIEDDNRHRKTPQPIEESKKQIVSWSFFIFFFL